MAANRADDDRGRGEHQTWEWGGGRWRSPLRTQGKAPKDCLISSWGFCFTSKLAKSSRSTPTPNVRSLAPAAVPRASVPLTQPVPLSPSRGSAGRDACVHWRDGEPGVPRAHNSPSATGAGTETQISNRLPSACTSHAGGRKVTLYLGLGAALGNLRPALLTPLWFRNEHFQRPLSL